ncbi:MAG TPA: translation elongation factor Ts [Rhodospirillales bacterium]
MAEITAALVKDLREKTGAGMMDCKKALVETAGNLDAAVDWLRTKGLAAAAKKAGRMAAEGLVGVTIEGDIGALVEVNAETDFVARNEAFQEFVAAVGAIAIASGGDLKKLSNASYPGTGRTVVEQLTHLIATIGENMALRRVRLVRAEGGLLASYVHNALTPSLGRIGALVALNAKSKSAVVKTLGKQLAMQIAASRPQAINRDGLDPALVERERGILAEQARATGKPEEIVAKMVEGRMRKFYEEVCLVDQTFVIDGETKVVKVLEAAAADAGGPVKVTDFGLFVLGEGIEKQEKNFAAEVRATIGN